MSKSQSRPGKMIGFYADAELNERLERMAERAGVSKSRLICNAVSIILDYLEGCDKFGVLWIGILYRDFEKDFKGTIHGILDKYIPQIKKRLLKDG